MYLVSEFAKTIFIKHFKIREKEKAIGLSYFKESLQLKPLKSLA
jgi:hypothetical protein